MVRIYGDFGFEVSRGAITGLSAIHKFGRNTDIDIGTEEDIWDGGGDWVPPTQARIHDIVSTDVVDVGSVVSSGTATSGSKTILIDQNATFQTDGVAVGDIVINDTDDSHGTIRTVDSETQITVWFMGTSTVNAQGDSYRIITSGGTGAAAVMIFGLDSDFNFAQEHIILNGTTDVVTKRTYNIIHRMFVIGAGSGDANAGTITATAQTDSTVTAQINIGNNQTLMAIFQVPIGKVAHMNGYYASVNKGAGAATIADITLLGKPIGEVFQLKHVRSCVSTGNSNLDHNFEAPQDSFIYSQLSIIKLRAGVTANNTDVSAGFELILRDI